jgi:hypothetical protein
MFVIVSIALDAEKPVLAGMSGVRVVYDPLPLSRSNCHFEIEGRHLR